MAILEIRKDPSLRDLFFFELFLLGILLAVGGYAYFHFRQWLIPGIMGGAAGCAFILFRVVPKLRRAAFFGWFYLTLPVGFLMSHALFALLYFVVLTPIGWIRRLLPGGKVTKSFDSSATSYWMDIESDDRVERYFKKF